MAGGGGSLELAPENPDKNIATNHGEMDNLLVDLLDKPQSTWMEYFREHTTDSLVDIREKVFMRAKHRYMDLLIKHGIHDTPVLTLTGRRGGGAHRRFVQDIYELHRYANGEIPWFPRETLTEKTRYVALQNNLTQQTDQVIHGNGLNNSELNMSTLNDEIEESNERQLSNEIEILKISLNEYGMKNMMLEEKLTRAERRIIDLEGHYDELKREVNSLKGLLSQNKQFREQMKALTPNTKGEKCTAENRSNRGQCVTDQTKSETIPETNKEPDKRQDTTESADQENNKTNDLQDPRESADNTRSGSNIEKRTPGGNSSTPMGTSTRTPQGNISTPGGNSNAPGHSRGSSEIPIFGNGGLIKIGSQSEDSEDANPALFTEVLNRKRKQKLKDNRVNESFTLKGAVQEQTVQMYIKNIEIDNLKQIDKVKEKVSNYLQKNGVKVFKMQVIRNRYVDTTIGCRITIRDSQREKIEQKSFWPAGIECRQWGRKRQYREYASDEENSYGNRWSDKYDRHNRNDRYSRYDRYDNNDRYDRYDRYETEY